MAALRSLAGFALAGRALAGGALRRRSLARLLLALALLAPLAGCAGPTLVLVVPGPDSELRGEHEPLYSQEAALGLASALVLREAEAEDPAAFLVLLPPQGASAEDALALAGEAGAAGVLFVWIQQVEGPADGADPAERGAWGGYTCVRVEDGGMVEQFSSTLAGRGQPSSAGRVVLPDGAPAGRPTARAFGAEVPERMTSFRRAMASLFAPPD